MEILFEIEDQVKKLKLQGVNTEKLEEIIENAKKELVIN
jgi:hypothetical protein